MEYRVTFAHVNNPKHLMQVDVEAVSREEAKDKARSYQFVMADWKYKYCRVNPNVLIGSDDEQEKPK